jgi:hypothetical protein
MCSHLSSCCCFPFESKTVFIEGYLLELHGQTSVWMSKCNVVCITEGWTRFLQGFLAMQKRHTVARTWGSHSDGTVVATRLPPCRETCLQTEGTSWNSASEWLQRVTDYIVINFFLYITCFLLFCSDGLYFCDNVSRRKQLVEWRRFGNDAKVLRTSKVIKHKEARMNTVYSK